MSYRTESPAPQISPERTPGIVPGASPAMYGHQPGIVPGSFSAPSTQPGNQSSPISPESAHGVSAGSPLEPYPASSSVNDKPYGVQP